MNRTPEIIEGRLVRLEQLSERHVDDLLQVGLEPELWRWTPHEIRNRTDLHAYVTEAIDERRSGRSIPFAVILQESAQAVGSTRFGNISVKDRRVEIGWTWIGREWHRTGVNTECKFLLLRHAFEEMKCVRVELKTDTLNSRSRRAIERLGARQEGILRKHVITASGRHRDTVYYAILDDEWPNVRRRLSRMMTTRRDRRNG